MSRGKGLLRPDPTKLARRLHASLHPLMRVAGPPKGAASLDICPIMDQGNTSTCHAHSAAAAVWCAMNAAGKPLPFVPSPLLIASTTYADGRAAGTPAGQPLPPLQDLGADLSDDAQALATWGVAPIQAPTADGRFSDVPLDVPGAPFPEPVLTQVQVAGADLIQGAYSIPIDDNAATLCAVSLDNGIPIWFGGPVNDSYEALTGDQIATGDDATGDEGHAQYLRGYRTVNTALQFQIAGSWSTGALDQGLIWCDASYLMRQWMLWLMAVRIG